MNPVRWVTCALPRQRRRPDPACEQATAELRAAQEKVRDLAERADSLVPRLEGRLRRNHWGETVAAIARREPL